MRSPLGSLLSLRNLAPPTSRPSTGRPSLLTGRTDTRTQELEAFGSVGTLFSIVNRTSNATSQVQWKLYRKPAPGRQVDPDQREQVLRHLALDVWNRPTPFHTRQELVEGGQQHVDLTGEGYVVISRNELTGWPEELWTVRPDRMVPVPSSTDFLAGWIYTGPAGDQKIPLEPAEVIQLRMPNPTDPYRGLGPVQSILVDLDSTKYSAEWNRRFFLNDATPGGVIEVPEELSDESFERLQRQFRQNHQGVRNAHRVAILEGSAKWVDRSFSMRDMQFTELRNVGREVIREAFGIPKFAVGDVDDVNRATADASASWFGEHLTRPRLERWKGALNNDFLPLFGVTGEGVEFDYELDLPDDREADNAELTARSAAVAQLVAAGYDPDDVLAAVGLPKMRRATAPAPVSAGGGA